MIFNGAGSILKQKSSAINAFHPSLGSTGKDYEDWVLAMAGIIKIRSWEPGKSWGAPNWIYWGILDYVDEELRDDPVAFKRLQSARAVHGLALPLIREEDPALADKIEASLTRVCERIVKRKLPCIVEGRVLPQDRQDVFVEAVQALLDDIRADRI